MTRSREQRDQLRGAGVGPGAGSIEISDDTIENVWEGHNLEVRLTKQTMDKKLALLE